MNKKWENNRDIYNDLKKHLGYGNINGKYWFFGMEENWTISNKKDIASNFTSNDYKYYSQKVVPLTDEYTKCKFDERKNQHGKFEFGICEILKLLGKCDLLLQDIFVTNAKFLPFPEKEASTYFGEINYQEDLEDFRKILYENWDKNSKITFCLGKGYRSEFIKILNLSSDSMEKKKQSNVKPRVELYKVGDKKIYMLDHPRAIQCFKQSCNELNDLLKDTIK